jgi:hypothetical protein
MWGMSLGSREFGRMWVFTWKFTYYSPNTYQELALSKKDDLLDHKKLGSSWLTCIMDVFLVAELFHVIPTICLKK